MNRKELRSIVATVLDCAPEQLQTDTILTDLENFDSVNILSLMVAFDDELEVKLDHDDLAQLVKYGDIENMVRSKGIALND